MLILLAFPGLFQLWDPNTGAKVAFVSGFIPISCSGYRNISVMADLIKFLLFASESKLYLRNCHFAEIRIWKSHAMREGVVVESLRLVNVLLFSDYCDKAFYENDDMLQQCSWMWGFQKSLDAACTNIKGLVYFQGQRQRETFPPSAECDN